MSIRPVKMGGLGHLREAARCSDTALPVPSLSDPAVVPQPGAGRAPDEEAGGDPYGGDRRRGEGRPAAGGARHGPGASLNGRIFDVQAGVDVPRMRAQLGAYVFAGAGREASGRGEGVPPRP